MQWTPGGSDSDLGDRRDEGGGDGGGFGGFGGMHFGVGGTIVLVVLSVVFRTNLFSVFSGSGPVPTHAVHHVPNATLDARERNEVEFVKFVLNDVQANWDRLLPQSGKSYRHAKLVLFRDETRSGCGEAQSAT